ncbi:MAG: 16S rRNA (uracil(1498)-N(3))-methyltransferase [Acidobacteriia bacterium]|nr:16S rRNA (uracil(1498)-N(3))-methyltransferase [Terriglobia bacterium]
MTRRRWIADQVSGNRAALTGAHADHLVRVLRVRVGQEFDIVANGVVRQGVVVAIADSLVDFELGEEIPAEPTAINLTLLLAIFKFDRMEWAIEKCTELGVTRIVPVIARRTDSHLASASAKRVERWRRLTVQAAEQSRRASPPEIANPVKLREAVTLPAELKIVLSEAEEQSQLRDVATPSGAVLLAVGPEGGWTEEELELFRKHDWLSASLGSTILRAETAAIAATAITMSALRR